MSPTSHQTARLSAGKHRSPEDGVCVMELASMLAGEPFDDHPRSVCPVIGAFLRVYNDGLDDERRQDLYACAALVVGSRADRYAERLRAERCRAILIEDRRDRRRLPGWLWVLSRVLAPAADAAAVSAARALLRQGDAGHERALALVGDLVRCGTPAKPRHAVPAAAEAAVVEASGAVG